MNLSKANAMQIVTEISSIIGQNVNLMDEDGLIIASTDPDRMYTFHGGAAHVIENGLDELIITSDDEYEGTRKGTNLPVVLGGRIVGVVGLTGEYDEVVKYGQIIKKMTEILIRENYITQQKKLDDRIRTRFLDEWILDGEALTPDFIERGKRLGIDVQAGYRVVVAEIADIARYSDTADGQMLIDRVNRMTRQTVGTVLGGIFNKTASRMICLLPSAYYSGARLASFARDLQQRAGAEHGVLVLFGIDDKCEDVHTAYSQAVKALAACSAARGKTICLYGSINLELFSGEVSGTAKREFVQRIFRDIAWQDIGGWARLLDAYYRHNSSLAKASEELFLHKNTLQYRLGKLHETTGHDPRYVNDAALFILALQFYNDLSK